MSWNATPLRCVAAVHREGISSCLFQHLEQPHRVSLRLQEPELCGDRDVDVSLERLDHVRDPLGLLEESRSHSPLHAKRLGTPAIDVKNGYVVEDSLAGGQGVLGVANAGLEDELAPLPLRGVEDAGARVAPDLGGPVLDGAELLVDHAIARGDLLRNYFLGPDEVRAVV